jgi:outer membrane protein OmpA-like peptidoglycan-associated protein
MHAATARERSDMRLAIRVGVMVAVAGMAGSACATKGFVRESVGEVSEKVETLGQSLEQTQEQTRENTARIKQVDQKADQAGAAAQTAQTAANTAGKAAEAANARAVAVETASKRLIYEVVISDDQGNFALGKSDLPDEVRTSLDELAAKLKAAPAGNYLEVEGHTDATGSPEANYRLGLERAENVKRYLYETYQIPLHKINVISFGESKPAAPNNTREGRAQNRRVVIRVLA